MDDREQLLRRLDRERAARKEAERLLEEKSTELWHHAARLQAANQDLESFGYSVSHDLRSPLRSVDGFSQALLEDYGDILDPQGQDYLRRIRKAVQHMDQLIDDMLSLARITRADLRREEVDLSAMARVISEELTRTAPDRQVDYVIPSIPSTRGDPHLLRLVLENLIGNAWKFTNLRAEARIEFGALDRDGKRVYFVRDNGAGFDMGYAEKLFGVFQRLHSPTDFPGTGVGLAIVQKIIHRHGGRVWGEGAVDEGATFYFTLE